MCPFGRVLRHSTKLFRLQEVKSLLQTLPWHLTIIHVDEACAVCHLATDQIHQGVTCHNDHGEGHASHEARLLAPQGSEGPSSLGGKTSYTSALCRIVYESRIGIAFRCTRLHCLYHVNICCVCSIYYVYIYIYS